MVWVFLMLVGTGLVLVWFWEKSPKTNSSVLPLRKEKTFTSDKIANVMESQRKEISVLFGAGLSQLEEHSMDRLREFLDPSILSQIGYITLIGSADASGHLVTNRRLVKERIRVVERYFLSMGISKDKIQKLYLEPSFGRSPDERRSLRSVKIQYNLET
ncbi:cell envelope biogenesis protein OmpA [Leptospira mtsangambouensis]|uniref:cell envelope biogenesis protein OmpA n=1 Tax=Leptospira mtsangambouensis TaxID=2484912 RepID=UPI001EEB12AC|nr:cell envelope biogenesis protein OmpA [Leptospira mtsangambouensis]MCG6141781.1 cell envelope biogenesis protein OmpA [Leptospira mtsangambouensis]